MIELLTSSGFWIVSILWFVLGMMLVALFDRGYHWNWKQGIFAVVLTGPVGLLGLTIVAAALGLSCVWEYLGDS